MIDSTVLTNAKKLKKTADASYLVFKKAPTIENANTWTAANRAFNDFCVRAISDLITDETTDNTADIIANPEKYKICKKCDAEILYLTSDIDNNYVASSDFVEDFPGWCYPCLLEHCLETDCEACTLREDPETCSFVEIKNLYNQSK